MAKKNDSLESLRREIAKLAQDTRRANRANRLATERLERETAESRARHKYLDAYIERVTGSIGVLSEGLLVPSIPKLLRPHGVILRTIEAPCRRRRDGKEIEFDLAGWGRMVRRGPVMVLVEIKTKLRQNYVDDFLERIPESRFFFPDCQDDAIIGVIGGVRIPTQVLPYAEKKGLFVLGPGDGVARTMNRKGFRPRLWPPAEPDTGASAPGSVRPPGPPRSPSRRR